MSRALDSLAAEFQLRGELLSTCAAEGREPSAAELRALDRSVSASRSGGLPVVQVRAEAATYAPPDARGGERVSFFRDLYGAQVVGDPDCRARIERHTLETRATGTTGTAPGVVPPTWLFQEFAVLQHGARPWADTLRRIQIDNANPVNIGTQTAGAVVAATTEGTAAPDGAFNATTLATQPVTYTGKVDVSRQLLDGSNPAIDGLVYGDCMGAYFEAIESAVVSAFGALTPPVTITYPGSPAYANLPDCFIDAATSLAKRRKLTATHALISAGAWAFLAKQKDQQGRPLLTTGQAGPTNAYGLTPADYAGGEVVGLTVIPSWAGVDNSLYVVRADDLILLESSTFNFRYEEVLGPIAIRLGVWGYAAPILGRYASSVIKINSGTTIPAPAEAETESAETTTPAKAGK
jgi:HK97 family phage major capsid protein